jgi:hypothetical protein
MNDYDAIKETVFHYYEGYRDKNRERLEKAFSLEVASMMGYIKNNEGEKMPSNNGLLLTIPPLNVPMAICSPLISLVTLVRRFYLISEVNI